MKKLVLCAAMALSLSSCALFERDRAEEPPLSAQSQEDVNVASGYILITELYYLAANAVKSKLITPDEGRRFLSLLDSAKKSLDVAAQLHFSGVEGSARKGMETVSVILNQIRAELNERERQRALKGGK